MLLEATISHYSPFKLRAPSAADGPKVHTLIGQCSPLDSNSLYCNLLQCHHFRDTCVLAEDTGGKPAGFVSAYLIPEQPSQLFVWQVATHPSARGKGLALSMCQSLLSRRQCAAVNTIQATINPGNRASWALFEKLARSLNTQMSKQPLFDKTLHFEDAHDSEILVSVGPFTARDVA
ncbi:MAG: diaminobutyrate acetyltransferase [Cellvibrionaceae bacterium]|nr:diaminobutyrate acetyltransferase [Cellvibrionaceae bacterium]